MEKVVHVLQSPFDVGREVEVVGGNDLGVESAAILVAEATTAAQVLSNVQDPKFHPASARFDRPVSEGGKRGRGGLETRLEGDYTLRFQRPLYRLRHQCRVRVRSDDLQLFRRLRARRHLYRQDHNVWGRHTVDVKPSKFCTHLPCHLRTCPDSGISFSLLLTSFVRVFVSFYLYRTERVVIVTFKVRSHTYFVCRNSSHVSPSGI